MPFVAGQKLRASQLQELEAAVAAVEQEIVVARVATDLSKTSSTALSDVTGLSFVLAANAEYLLDGQVSVYGVEAADIKFAFTGPTGMTVSWNPGGPGVTLAGASVGSSDYFSAEAYGDANTFPVGLWVGSALMCRPAGYFKTGGTAGTLQLRYAQNTSNATATTVKRGSWLRLQRFS